LTKSAERMLGLMQHCVTGLPFTGLLLLSPTPFYG
jgi:hypothetical protein